GLFPQRLGHDDPIERNSPIAQQRAQLDGVRRSRRPYELVARLIHVDFAPEIKIDVIDDLTRGRQRRETTKIILRTPRQNAIHHVPGTLDRYRANMVRHRIPKLTGKSSATRIGRKNGGNAEWTSL